MVTSLWACCRNWLQGSDSLWLCSNFPVATRGTAAEKVSYALKACKSITSFILHSLQKNEKLIPVDSQTGHRWHNFLFEAHCDVTKSTDTTAKFVTTPLSNQYFYSQHHDTQKKHPASWNLPTEHFAKEVFQQGVNHAAFWSNWWTHFYLNETQPWGASWGHLFLPQPQACGPLTHRQSFSLLMRDCNATVIQPKNPTLLSQNNRENWYRTERTIAARYWRLVGASWRISKALTQLLLPKANKAKLKLKTKNG